MVSRTNEFLRRITREEGRTDNGSTPYAGPGSRYRGTFYPIDDPLDIQELIVTFTTTSVEFTAAGQEVGDLPHDMVEWRRATSRTWRFDLAGAGWLFEPASPHLFEAKVNEVMALHPFSDPGLVLEPEVRGGIDGAPTGDDVQIHVTSSTVTDRPLSEPVPGPAVTDKEIDRDHDHVPDDEVVSDEPLQATPPSLDEPIPQVLYSDDVAVPLVAGQDEPAVEGVDLSDLSAVHGIGPKYSEKLNSHGIHTLSDLAEADISLIEMIREVDRGLATKMERGGWAGRAQEILAEAVVETESSITTEPHAWTGVASEEEEPVAEAPVGGGSSAVVEQPAVATPVAEPRPTATTPSPPAPARPDETPQDGTTPDSRWETLTAALWTMVTDRLGSIRRIESYPFGRTVAAFPAILGLVLLGYAFLDRGFAWIHVPGIPAFVGELTLLAGFTVLYAHSGHLFRAFRENGSMAFLGLFILWGFILTLGGLPEWGLDAIRDAAIWYYALLALMVVVTLSWRPTALRDWLRGYERVTPWLLVWLPLAVFAGRSPAAQNFLVPDSTVSIFSHKPSNIGVHAMIVIVTAWAAREWSSRASSRSTWITVAGVLVVLVSGTVSRSGLLAALVGMGVFLALRPRPGNTAIAVVGVMVGAVVLGLAADSFLPEGTSTAPRSVSAEQVIENVESILDPDSAADHLSGTSSWRLDLWANVIRDVNEEAPLTGLGFGMGIAERYGADWTAGSESLRNPHNSHLNVFARMGWLGFAIWVAMWTAWYVDIVRAHMTATAAGDRRRSAMTALVISVTTAILFNAFFDPTLEGAQVALWTWTLFGIGVALTQRAPTPAHQDRSLLQT